MNDPVTSLIPRSTLTGLIETEDRDKVTVQMPPIQLEGLLVPHRQTQVLRTRPTRKKRRTPDPEAWSYMIVAIGFATGIGIGLACLA